MDLVVKLQFNTKLVDVKVASDASFLDLKVAAAQATGVPVEDIKLLFRGREREDGSAIYAAGVKGGSKVMLVESEARRAARAGAAVAETEAAAGAQREAAEQAFMMKAIDAVRAEVDGLEGQVKELVAQGPGVAEKAKANMVNELLERALLKLDGVTATGGAREARRGEVKRVTALCHELDGLRG